MLDIILWVASSCNWPFVYIKISAFGFFSSYVIPTERRALFICDEETVWGQTTCYVQTSALVSVGVCSEDEPFCFRHYLNQKCIAPAQWASIWAMGCKVYFLIILLLSQFSQLLGHIYTYAFSYYFNNSFLCFWGTAAWDFFYLFQVAYLCQFVL
jgi:hypothetical protein